MQAWSGVGVEGLCREFRVWTQHLQPPSSVLGADPVLFQIERPDLGVCLPAALLGQLPSVEERQPGSQRRGQRAEMEGRG